MRALVWFRTDLRLDDNPALHAACAKADMGVLALFIATPNQWRAHDMAPIRADLIRRTLQGLSPRLAARNIALKVLTVPTFDDVPKALLTLATEHHCDALFFNREYEINERRRDHAVRTAFEQHQRSVHESTDQCLFEPGTIRTGKDTYYTVFTPFKRAWYQTFTDNPDHTKPLGLPKKQPAIISDPDEIQQSFEGFTDIPAHAADWPAGEAHARRQLDHFLDHHLPGYKDTRDFPAQDSTSRLSPHLAVGSISLRRCVHEALARNDHNLDTGSPGAVHWISELIWREFYKHILVGFPRVSMHRAFNPATEKLRWNDNPEHLLAWQEGRTGIPIVDAAMRQLTTTGWMHNRLRMVTAMFLTKNLFIDWRHGERFFMQHLIDGDLAANNGGWQWSASTGTDAAPYFRIMNPLSQSRRFDPAGDFIRKHLPELAHLDSKAIHDPSELPPLARANLDYPEPIIDLAASRTRAIEAFQSI